MSLYQIRDPQPHEIFNFFHESNFRKSPKRTGPEKLPRSNQDFLKEYQFIDTQRFYFLLDSYVARRLLRVKHSDGHANWYESTIWVPPEDQAYGAWTYEIDGFPKIRSDFSDSVLSIVVENSNGDSDIGSAFMLEGNRVVTAKHCVDNMNEIRIGDWGNRKGQLQHIFVSQDDSLDLAVLKFDGPVFGSKEFLLDEAKTLDEVLAMGYPPIPGFQKVQVAETAKVAAIQKATVGDIVADDAEPYLGGKYSNLLVSARIKGGNSGGPIINKFGKVVGIAEMLPADAQGQADQLGFAVAICSSELKKLLAQISAGEAKDLPFKDDGDSVSTKIN